MTMILISNIDEEAEGEEIMLDALEEILEAAEGLESDADKLEMICGIACRAIAERERLSYIVPVGSC